MDLTSILLRPGDLPAGHVAGELKTLTGDHPILHNIGDASFLAKQWIGTVGLKDARCGEVAAYEYKSPDGARRFFDHFIKDIVAEFLPGVGDDAVIHYEWDEAAGRETTAIRFLRHRVVVAIRGWTNQDPPPARSVLTRDALISYAERLDLRLLEFDD